MPSAALLHQVSTLQREADLLDEYAKVLSNFAGELFSFASTFSFHSGQCYTHSDELSRLAGMILAGGTAMETAVSSKDDNAVTGVTRQTTRAAETINVRNNVTKVLHHLAKVLSGHDQEVQSEEKQTVRKHCQIAVMDDLDNGDVFAAACGMAFVMGGEQRTERGCRLDQDDIEVASSIVKNDTKHEDAKEDAMAAYANSRKQFRSLTGEVSLTEKLEQLKENSFEPGLEDDRFSTLKRRLRVGTRVRQPQRMPTQTMCRSSSESDDLPPYDDGMTGRWSAIPKCNSMHDFLRNASGLARSATCPQIPQPLKQPLILEAARRTANSSLASGKLSDCSAALL